MSAAVDSLSKLVYFHGVPPAELERAARAAKELSFEKGEVLFLEGEPCKGLYLVESGRIRVFKSSLEGREQVLMIAGAGDSFNDVPVFDGGPNPASALALEPATVLVVPKEAVLEPIKGCPAAAAVLKLFAGRLRYLTGVVEDLSFRPVLARLAKVLLEAAEEEGGASPSKRLTQDEMAAMVGSVRDVVGRALKQLQREGAIRVEGRRILIVDQEKLRDIS